MSNPLVVNLDRVEKADSSLPLYRFKIRGTVADPILLEVLDRKGTVVERLLYKDDEVEDLLTEIETWDEGYYDKGEKERER